MAEDVRYEVSVTRRRTVRAIGDKKWQKMHDREDGTQQWGYAEPIEETKEEYREVFKQVIEVRDGVEFDLATLVKAINP